MKFVDKIFGYEYFGVILFCVIAFLILVFFLILFLGLTDTKAKDKKKEEKKLEEEKDAFLRIDDTIKLDVVKEKMASFDSDDENVSLPKKKDDDNESL